MPCDIQVTVQGQGSGNDMALRLQEIKRKHDQSRVALKAWVQAQERELCKEEDRVRMMEEAIDVESADNAPSPIGESNDHDEMIALHAEAEQLLSEFQKE